MLQPPNALELVGPEKPLWPDHEAVLENFLGKSQEEARTFYEDRCHYLTENFMWMAPAGLEFYLPPFLDYLKSDEGKRDWEAAHGILCALSVQIGQHPEIPRSVLEQAWQICAYVKQHCKRFWVDPHDELYRSYLAVIEGAKRRMTFEGE